MSTIKIPAVSKSSVPNPEIGNVILFPDSDNGGNLSQRDKDGNIVDLTQATNALFNSTSTVTEFKVNEFNRTITSAELLSMSHDKFKNPEGGIELLPAPTAGKCYIITMDAIFAQYISNSNRGYDPFPYAEYRSLDVYYPNQSDSTQTENQRIFSIPLMSMPNSEWINRSRSDAYGVGTSTIFWQYGSQESLAIDKRIDTTIYQQQQVNAQASGFSNWSIIDQAIWIGTNGELAKQLPSSDGEIKIRFWYAELDISDITTQYTEQNPLPEYALTYKKIKNYFYFTGLDFLDNPQRELPISYWDNYPQFENSPTIDPEDFATTYRAARDQCTKFQAEYLIAKEWGRDGLVRSAGQIDEDFNGVPKAPQPNPYLGLTYDKLPLPTGPDYTFWGFPTERNFIKGQESSIEYPPFSGYRRSILPYDVAEGTSIHTGVYSKGVFEDFYFDTTSGRVASVTIDNPGTGYLAGDGLKFVGGGATQVAKAVISKVGTSGEILEISFEDNGDGYNIFGGQYYTSVPTINISTTGGSNAVLTAVIENGQWIEQNNYIKTTSFGDSFAVADLDSTFRATRDAGFKALNELIDATAPFIDANLSIPALQIEKYKL